jgi:hypothetical protein
VLESQGAIVSSSDGSAEGKRSPETFDFSGVRVHQRSNPEERMHYHSRVCRL